MSTSTPELVYRIGMEIKKKGSNFRRVEQELCLGNGTIKRWNFQSPRLDKLIIVSEYLQVSLDYLVFGRSCSEKSGEDAASEDAPVKCDGIPLSQMEADLVAMFRCLDARDGATAFDFVEMLYERSTGEKGSIYSTYSDAEKGQKSDPAEGGEAQGGIA